MNDQVDLFGGPQECTCRSEEGGVVLCPLHRESRALARSGDPDTSKEAAAHVNVNRLEWIVLDTLGKLGGEGTSSEVAEKSGEDKWSISPRFKPLEKKGLIRRTEKRRDRQIVWALEGKNGH